MDAMPPIPAWIVTNMDTTICLWGPLLFLTLIRPITVPTCIPNLMAMTFPHLLTLSHTIIHLSLVRKSHHLVATVRMFITRVGP
ncbi:hypothetical protein EMPG_14732 [Blastomyces silverae]|uniref:Uncharacterized protein n=1 Tax=Blastomyces silverae TaxID=2060906 RepID=A0A0H1BEI0_9EURO|nr:hypothetical protein EMPG_14732 [Blastomyces silverae]